MKAVASTMFSTRLPRAATMAMASTNSGKAIITSTKRPTARMAAERAGDGTEHKGNADRRDGNDEVEPGRNQEPAEIVAAKLIGAGKVQVARRLQRLRHIGSDRIVRRDRRAEDRNQHQKNDAGGGNRRQRI